MRPSGIHGIEHENKKQLSNKSFIVLFSSGFKLYFSYHFFISFTHSSPLEPLTLSI